MSDEDPKAAGGAEPSMEDILASIRRILAEDGAAAASDAVETETADSLDTPEKPEEDEPPVAPSSSAEDEPEPVVPVMPKPVSPPFAADVFGDAFSRNDEEEDVFVLTPEMRIEVAAGSIGGERVVSHRTAATGTDVLAQLASAILDRRDIAVAARDVTLEGMVREMLRPLLREWLDRNLPYLIERLVKREIDLMINRAERLED